MALPATAAKIISLPDNRHKRYQTMQSSLCRYRRELACFSFAVAGAKLEIISLNAEDKRCNLLLRYITSWTTKIRKIERRCAQLTIGMDVLEQKGVLL